MVTINTENLQKYENIVLSYLVELPRSECFFSSARDAKTGKLHLFLVFIELPSTKQNSKSPNGRFGVQKEKLNNHKGRIYSRRAITETWEEISNPHEYERIRGMVTSALYYKTVPCYRTEGSFASLN